MLPDNESLRSKAISLLARREHAYLELKRKLSGKADDESIIAVLDSLRDEDLQSDLRFARSYIRSRQHAGYGPVRIRQELLQRGVAESLIDQELCGDTDYWSELLTEVWQKKYGGVMPDNAKSYGQQMRFLLHRGFTMEMIRSLI